MQLEGTREEMEAAAALLDAADGYPKRGGAGVGRGPFTAMPETWDGTGAVPAGWTGRHAIAQHPTDAALYALPIKSRHTGTLDGASVAGRRVSGADFVARGASWRRGEG